MSCTKSHMWTFFPKGEMESMWWMPMSSTGSSPIGLCVLRDIESNMCCTKISVLDYFSKSRNWKSTSFGSQSVLKVPLRIRDKTNAIFQVYLLKNRCWSLPFPKTPLLAIATPSDWRRTASSRIFGVYKARFPPKSYTSRICITLRTLCEAKDVGYSYDFLKNSPNPRFW